MKKKEGHCHICGKFGALTKEHVPPQKAFNDKKIISATSDKAEELRYDEKPEGMFLQGGVHFFSLCRTCNNAMGRWYGGEYVHFAKFAMYLGSLTQNNPPNINVTGYPLRLIKQIVSMFFSINPKLRLSNPELVNFVLDKEKKCLPEKIRIFGFYNFEGNLRYNRIAIGGKNMSVFSEFAYPPLGFVMTYNNTLPPDDRMYDISFFAESGYDEKISFELKMPTLPTYLDVPGTYLTKEEIEENYRNNDFYPDEDN